MKVSASPVRGKGRRPRGTSAAEAFIKRLQEPAFRAAIQFSDEEMAILNKVACGWAPRNVATILAAMRLKAEYAYSKPKQEVEVAGKGGGPVVVRVDRAE